MRWAIKGEIPGIQRGRNAFRAKNGCRPFFYRILPARSWEMPDESELPAKLGRCWKKPPGCNFYFRAKASFMYISNILSRGFCSKVKIATWRLFPTPPEVFSLSWNKGQLCAAITRPCRLSTPLCHTYSEPPGHEDSPATTFYIPYLLKIWVNRDWASRFLGFFLVISEVWSQTYIANLAIFKIWVFSATFLHKITFYAKDIDKKRFRTPF